MASFLTDEDMPRPTAPTLRQAGYEAEDVRDIGLGGHIQADELNGLLGILELGRRRIRRPFAADTQL